MNNNKNYIEYIKKRTKKVNPDLLNYILTQNEFYSIREIILDLEIYGMRIKNGKIIRTMEEYSKLNITNTYGSKKTNNLVNSIKKNIKEYSKNKNFEILLRYSELYCMYALYPIEVSLELIKARKLIN